MRPCFERLKAAGLIVGIAGNQTLRAGTLVRELNPPADFITTSDDLGAEKPDVASSRSSPSAQDSTRRAPPTSATASRTTSCPPRWLASWAFCFGAGPGDLSTNRTTVLPVRNGGSIHWTSWIPSSSPRSTVGISPTHAAVPRCYVSGGRRTLGSSPMGRGARLALSPSRPTRDQIDACLRVGAGKQTACFGLPIRCRSRSDQREAASGDGSEGQGFESPHPLLPREAGDQRPCSESRECWGRLVVELALPAP